MKKVLIILGGKSGEHEVSLRSAESIINNIDHHQFSTSTLKINQDGSWQWADGSHTQDLSKFKDFNIVFPIIHGTNGEDGKLQGLLEMAGVPYVGAGVLGSAICMDKVIQKQLCAQASIPQTKYVCLHKSQISNLKFLISNLQFPLFVKPANLGSSVGISKVKTSAQLQPAIDLAFQFDNKIIIEEGVEDILEIEVAVLGNERPETAVCGSIKPNTEFYDYQTKYITDDIVSHIPAEIPENIANQIRKTAEEAFTLLNCSGLARIDFFYQPASQKFYLNEVNTLPGFTSISMYPKMWAKSGLSYQDLINKLLSLAEERHHETSLLKTSTTTS